MFSDYRCPFPGVKGPEREVDHSTPFSTKIKNVQRHISTPHIWHHGAESHNFALVIANRRIILLKFMFVQLFQTYYTYYRTWRFAAIFTKKHPSAPIFKWKNPVHFIAPYICNMWFNIILRMVSGPFSSVFPSYLTPEFSYECSE